MLSKLKQLFLIGMSLLLVGCSVAATEPQVKATTVLPQFEAVVSELTTTEVPILLPTEIPQDYLASLTEDGSPADVFASVSLDQANFYEINLDPFDGCNGATYCYMGQLSGEHITAETPSIEEEFSYLTDPTYRPIERSPEEASTVALADGIEGHFIPWVCGASCDTAKVVWEQDGNRYEVGLRMATKAQVVALANSTIENQSVTAEEE